MPQRVDLPGAKVREGIEVARRENSRHRNEQQDRRTNAGSLNTASLCPSGWNIGNPPDRHDHAKNAGPLSREVRAQHQAADDHESAQCQWDAKCVAVPVAEDSTPQRLPGETNHEKVGESCEEFQINACQ